MHKQSVWSSLLRIIRTVRYLKIRQVLYRPVVLLNRVRKRKPAVYRLQDRKPCGALAKPLSPPPSLFSNGKVRFLNRSGNIQSAADWQYAGNGALWLYNLHYLDGLRDWSSKGEDDCRAEYVRLWVKHNPPGRGKGWDSYPTSLRIVNWIKWTLISDNTDEGLRESLGTQAHWLSRNIEWHLLGNHLFANAKALVFAGLFFEGKFAERWLSKGLQILGAELREQILDDGGHFERSPMYHSIMLEDVLDLIAINQVWRNQEMQAFVPSLHEIASRMLQWLVSMCHPDGQFALFNDCAYGVAQCPRQLVKYAASLGIENSTNFAQHLFLRDSGYSRAEVGDGLLFVDCGEIGPDYLPGHAHADSLSFEFSLFGQRLFVDSGTSTYEPGIERLRQRGTAAHNTVVVDNEDSSEVWSSFRVARRARPIAAEGQVKNGTVHIAAGHDGYNRLPGNVTHFRDIELSAESLTISDTLTGAPTSATANFLVHPDVVVSISEDNVVLFFAEHRATMSIIGGKPTMSNASWHPEFGLSVPTKRISVTLSDTTLVSTVRWDASQ